MPSSLSSKRLSSSSNRTVREMVVINLSWTIVSWWEAGYKQTHTYALSTSIFLGFTLSRAGCCYSLPTFGFSDGQAVYWCRGYCIRQRPIGSTTMPQYQSLPINHPYACILFIAYSSFRRNTPWTFEVRPPSSPTTMSGWKRLWKTVNVAQYQSFNIANVIIEQRLMISFNWKLLRQKIQLSFI